MSGYPADTVGRGDRLDSDTPLPTNPFRKRPLAEALHKTLNA